MSASDHVDLLKIMPRELREMLRSYLLYDEIDVTLDISGLACLFIKDIKFDIGFLSNYKLAHILNSIKRCNIYKEANRINPMLYDNMADKSILDYIDNSFIITILSPMITDDIINAYSNWYQGEINVALESNQKISKTVHLPRSESEILLLKLEHLLAHMKNNNEDITF